MNKQKLESLLGGPAARNLSPDAAVGLNSLANRFAKSSEEDALFEVAVRKANDDELRRLARFRIESERSKYLD